MPDDESNYIILEPKKVTMSSFVLNPFLLAVKDAQGNSNVMVVSYVGVASEVPPIITLAIRPSRYSHGLISQKKDFTLNFPSLKMLPVIDFCGTFSGRKIDKAAKLNLKFKEAEVVDAQFVLSSPLIMECRLQSLVELSKTEGATHDLFIAKVVNCLIISEFNIEAYNPVVTTNYTYRLVGEEIGKAHNYWHKKTGG
ncbi:MAG: flavin reductase family protein [Candidatus Magasanikbacteria bacterium]|nr:flavin reductase family protein [Candidatus Magasanikbacteria bacterium]